MTFKQEHPVLFSIGSIFCICIAIVAVTFSINYFMVEKTKIDAEKEKVIAEIHEREETERVEERSQFWQKLIPWGSDEDETNK